MKRGIWFWLCFIVAILLAVYFATRTIMTFTGHGDLARIRNISISADKNDKDLSSLATAASIAPGTRTYAVNLDNMNARISNVPGVKKSAVRRMPNGNLIVRTSMHTAVALWTDGQYYYPLSADGTIVQKPTDIRDESHVVFRGPVPNDITEITNAVHNLVGNLDYIEWIENRRWNIYTNGGITVMLPERDPITAIGTLITLNNNHKILARDIHIIDMRDTTRILIK